MVLREREPRLAGQPDVARVELVADLVERQRALADEPAVHARRERSLTLSPEPAGEERPNEDDAEHRDRDGDDGLEPDRAVGEDEGQQTPAANAPTARKIEKNVVLASSSTRSASAATNQIA